MNNNQERENEDTRKFFLELRKNNKDIKGMSKLDSISLAARKGSEISYNDVYIVTKEVSNPEHKGDSFLSYEVYSKNKVKLFETDPNTGKMIVEPEQRKLLGMLGIKIGENGEIDRTLNRIARQRIGKDKDGQEVEFTDDVFVTSDSKDFSSGDVSKTLKEKEESTREHKTAHDIEAKENEKKVLDENELKEKLEADKEKKDGGKAKVKDVIYIDSPVFYELAAVSGKGSYRASIVRYDDETYALVNGYGEVISDETVVGRNENIDILRENGLQTKPALASFKVGSNVMYVTMDQGREILSFNGIDKLGEESYTLKTNNGEQSLEERGYADDATTDVSDIEETKVKEVIAENGEIVTTEQYHEIVDKVKSGAVKLDDKAIGTEIDNVQAVTEEEEELARVQEEELDETATAGLAGGLIGVVATAGVGTIVAGVINEEQGNAKTNITTEQNGEAVIDDINFEERVDYIIAALEDCGVLGFDIKSVEELARNDINIMDKDPISISKEYGKIGKEKEEPEQTKEARAREERMTPAEIAEQNQKNKTN